MVIKNTSLSKYLNFFEVVRVTRLFCFEAVKHQLF